MTGYSFSKLKEIIKSQNIPVYDDSRKVTQGSVFVACPGSNNNGVEFISDAIAHGAAFIVCPHDAQQQGSSVQYIVVDDLRQALGSLASLVYRTDNLQMSIVGVTGTNGKTTTTQLLSYLFTMKQKKTGVLGTIAYQWPGHIKPSPLTTPGCLELHRLLAEMEKVKTDTVFMEVSSHALDQQRVAGIPFSGAIFLNMTQDHLDYHHDMDKYFFAKARLFSECPLHNKVMVASTDSLWGKKLAEAVPGIIGFGFNEKPSCVSRYMQGKIVSSSKNGLELEVCFEGVRWTVKTPLVGHHNAENLLAVQALSIHFGIEREDFQCFEFFSGVPGRLERINNSRGLDIFVDYAHTPDALLNVISALKDVGFKRVVTVFGCGGDRDRTKRILMGEAVALKSDVAVLTSDNPRTEDPQKIIDDVIPGLKRAKEVIVEADREKAIHKAIELLEDGDALLVAGKGHEQTQQIGTIKYPFSDQDVIRKFLQ